MISFNSFPYSILYVNLWVSFGVFNIWMLFKSTSSTQHLLDKEGNGLLLRGNGRTPSFRSYTRFINEAQCEQGLGLMTKCIIMLQKQCIFILSHLQWRLVEALTFLEMDFTFLAPKRTCNQTLSCTQIAQSNRSHIMGVTSMICSAKNCLTKQE